MRTLIIFIITLAISMKISAQSRIGSTAAEIKADFPEYTFTTAYTDDGTKYMYTTMSHGVFFYYFDKNGVSNYCAQMPETMADLNALVELYNSKYVITSKFSWSAYVEGGVLFI